MTTIYHFIIHACQLTVALVPLCEERAIMIEKLTNLLSEDIFFHFFFTSKAKAKGKRLGAG